MKFSILCAEDWHSYSSSQSTSWIPHKIVALRATSTLNPNEDDRQVKMVELEEGQPYSQEHEHLVQLI